MPFVSKKEKLKLTGKIKETLKAISISRTKSISEIERAKILLYYSNGETISAIARKLKTNRVKIENCVNKALQFGALTALKDLPRSGRPNVITDNAKKWFMSIACTKPKDLGFSSEYWTQTKLAGYIRKSSTDAGYPCLSQIGKGTVSKLLNKSDIKPHKISYYLVKKDPDFEPKMNQVLHVYKEVELLKSNPESQSMNILSYDEKPGIQAIENIAPDLSPIPGMYSTWGRDYEYKRHGTISLLASIDLVTGLVIAEVYDRHRSCEFVSFLKKVDQSYPKNEKIKIILDNHSSHISKETQTYLALVPNRFEFVFTPKHASWLNMIEIFFSKMTRSFLRGIRVKSKEELKIRIIKFIDEVNEMPTIFNWKWRMNEISV